MFKNLNLDIPEACQRSVCRVVIVFLLSVWYSVPMSTSIPIIHQDQSLPRKRAVPAIWGKVAGSLKGKNIDGLRYQKSVRKEWEQRLRRQIKLGTKKRGNRH